MKILFLSAYFCLPPATGSRIRTMEILKALSARHEVTYLAFADDEHQRDSLEAARRLCAEVKVVFREHGYDKLALLRGLVGRTPFTILNFRHPEMARLAAKAQASGGYDLIHVESIHVAQYANFDPARPMVLSTHNIESTIMKRFMEATTNPLKRFYAGITCRKLRRYEAEMMPRFDRTIVVTREEERLACEMARQARVVVIPNGVDIEEFKPDPDVKEEPATLVFSGLMDSRSNVDGVLYFVREILPLIRREMPETKLRVLGQRPAPPVQALADEPGIEVTGFVPDVRPLAQSGTLHVVPLRIGGGSRLKILQALALGKAVVSTQVGAEGLELSPGEHFLLADEPRVFAEQTVSLLRDPARRAALGQAGRRLAVERYNWKAITAPLLPLYEQLLAEKRAGRARGSV